MVNLLKDEAAEEQPSQCILEEDVHVPWDGNLKSSRCFGECGDAYTHDMMRIIHVVQHCNYSHLKYDRYTVHRRQQAEVVQKSTGSQVKPKSDEELFR